MSNVVFAFIFSMDFRIFRRREINDSIEKVFRIQKQIREKVIRAHYYNRVIKYD